MKKLLLAYALLSCLHANSQTPHYLENSDKAVRSIEVEIGGGAIFGASKMNFEKSETGGMGFGEMRYNFKHLPIDVGVQIAGNVFDRWTNTAGNLGFTSVNCMAVSDYNFRREKNISLFAGIGLGLAWHENAAPITHVGGNGYTINGPSKSFCFMPRIGVELFHHLRVTFNYKLEEKANRHCNISFGVVFGGGCRRK